VSEFQIFSPLPEPDPPDFDRLPVGTRQVFDRRLDRVPIGRFHSRIGVEAIMTNESRALHEYEREHHLSWAEFAPLGTWHMRAVHDRISSARPDLLAPRKPSGFYVDTQTPTREDRIRGVLVRWGVWNFINGTYTWLRNRAIDLRAISLRLTG
jgi:hypothetical protein